MSQYHILIVEDDAGLNQGIQLALAQENLAFSKAYSLAEARTCWNSNPPDMVLLDVNLPDGSGYDFLKLIRRESSIPVLLITANDLELDEVTGLSLGADDYITKPFSLMVLRARVDRMRQRFAPAASHIYENGPYLFDFDKLIFRVNGTEILLSRTEQRLLRLFVKHSGQILKRELLLDRIWTDGAEFVEENALSVTVTRLRRKLEISHRPSPIQTVYGTGYLWNPEE